MGGDGVNFPYSCIDITFGTYGTLGTPGLETFLPGDSQQPVGPIPAAIYGYSAVVVLPAAETASILSISTTFGSTSQLLPHPSRPLS